MLLTRRKIRRRGFTLVEMLVAAALCMFIMVILTGAFQSGIEAFRQLRATGQMAERLRQATALLRRDLAAQHFDGSFQAGLSGPYLSDQRLDRVGWVPPEQGYVRFYSPRLQREGRDSDLVLSTRMKTPADAPIINTAGAATDATRLPAMSMTVKLPGNSLAEVAQANMPYVTGQTPPGQLAAVNMYEYGGNNTFVSRWSEVSYYLVAKGDTTVSGLPLYTLFRKQTAMVPDGVSGVKNTGGGNYAAPVASASVTNPVNNSDLSQVYPVRANNPPAGPPADPSRYLELDPAKYTRFASPAEATIPNYKIANVGARNSGTTRPQGFQNVAGNGANRPNFHRLPLPIDRATPAGAGIDTAFDQPVLHEVVSMEMRYLWDSMVVTDPNGNVRQLHANGADTQALMGTSVGYANPLLASAVGSDPLSRRRPDNYNISDVDDALASQPFRELPRYTYAPYYNGSAFTYGYRPGGLNTSLLATWLRQDTGNNVTNAQTVGAVSDINYAVYRPDALQFRDTFDTWTRRSLPLQFPNLKYVNWDDSSIAPPVPQGTYRSGNPYEDLSFVPDPNTSNNVPTGSLVPFEDRPPLRIRIRAVQIKLRIWDAKTQQTRQVTIVQDV